MKVLHLFNEIKFSGGELMYASAAPFFQSNGITMLAFGTGKSLGDFAPEFEKRDIQVYHRPIALGNKITLSTFRFYHQFFQFLKSKKVDVLHIHRNDLYIAAICAWLAGTRTIKTMHSVYKNRKFTYPWGCLQRFLARKLFKVTFHTIGKSVYENELNYYKNPSVCINNWYDSQLFSPASSREKIVIREKLGIRHDAFVIVSVGGCSYIKNHFDIIKALHRLKADPNLHYLHLGWGSTEEEEKALASDLGVMDKISFVGNVCNVKDYLKASDVFIMTSKFEGLSIASIEAMACGLPSVLYNSPGLRDLISNDDNGFLIERDYHDLAEKIKAYRQNRTLIKSKGNAAAAYARKNHSMEENVQKIIALYRNGN